MRTIETISFAPASRECAGALRATLIGSSLSAGWTSCVLDLVEGDGAADLHETRATPDLTLVVATRGEHDVEVLDGGRWHSAVYRPGSVGTTPPGETTRLRWRNRLPRSTFRTAHLYVPATMLIEAAELLRRPGQRLSTNVASVLVADDRVIASTVTSLLAATARRETDDFAETALRWLALHLLADYADRGGARPHVRDALALPDARMARAVEFMSANLARPITVADVAREAGVSPFYFSRLFSRRTGLSPHAYLRRMRMEKAQALLEAGLSIGTVAFDCGYANVSSFSHAYSRAVGRPPSSLHQRQGT